MEIVGTIAMKISYRPYKKIGTFNSYFYKEILDWLLGLDDQFDYENIFYGRKLTLLLIKLLIMPYFVRYEYNLIESNEVKKKFINGKG